MGRELSCWVFRPALCLAQCLVDTQYMRAAAEELRALGCLYKLTLVLSNFEIIGKLLFFFFPVKPGRCTGLPIKDFGIKVYIWEKAIC